MSSSSDSEGRGGDAVRVFELDVRAEHAVARLRFVGAFAVGLSATWLALHDPGPLGWTLVAAGWLATVGWFLVALRASRRAGTPFRHRLTLFADRLRLDEGARSAEVRWSDVRAVEVDEDRLVVVVERIAAPPMLVEPHYAGVSIYELRDAIREASRGRPV